MQQVLGRRPHLAVPRTGILPEVQALRALAVSAVVLFHFWPRALPGGYVGVDVFFVISGFLITGQIARGLDAGTFGFRDFYVRRAKRLLPAAALVLGVTVATVLVLLPYSRWRDTMVESLASLFYVENWVLGLGGDDYFAADASPVQHYWSLSVEEQFYLVWPALLALLWWWVRPSGSRRLVVWGLVLVSAVSFAASVVDTAAEPTRAFFATYTRVWEFGVGAVLALLPRWTSRPAVRAVLGWVGLGAIAASAVVLDEGTPFPGAVALLPVLGAAAVIGAGLVDRPWSSAAVVRRRPVQWLGDVSYSVYLWHWPPVVLVPLLLGSPPGRVLEAALLVACVLLGWATKVLVEDRYRDHRPTARRLTGGPPVRRAGRAVLAMVAAAAVLASGGLAVVQWRAAAAAELEQQALRDGLGCFGSAALRDPGCRPPFGDEMVPDPGTALHLFTSTDAYDDCFVDVRSDAVLSCTVGDPDGDLHVVLAGDSHALHWLPALESAALADGWRVTTYLRGSCPLNVAVTYRPDVDEQERCAEWSRDVVERIAADASVDLVVTTASNSKAWVTPEGLAVGDEGLQVAADGYAAVWRRFVDDGTRVLVLADTPRPRDGVLDCLATRDAASCGVDRDEATAAGEGGASDEDPLMVAAERLADPRVTPVDPTGHICGARRCEAVVGNVVVFVDGSHLSTTYARTLAPVLKDWVAAALG